MKGSFRLLFDTGIKLLRASFFLFISAYFLLASVPYTNLFLIHSPPYHWLTWFVHNHRLLYFVVLLLTCIESWDFRRSRLVRLLFVLLAILGVSLAFSAALQKAESNWISYVCSLAFLLAFAFFELAKLMAVPALAHADDS